MTATQAKVGLRDFSMLIALVLISCVFWLWVHVVWPESCLGSVHTFTNPPSSLRKTSGDR